MVIKKLLIFLVSCFVFPVYCFLMADVFHIGSIDYTHLFTAILYLLLTLMCIGSLRGSKVTRRNAWFSLLIGILTMAYTIPLRAIGIAAGICTGCVFLACRKITTDPYSEFVWIRKDFKSNLVILGCVSLLYLCVYLMRYRGRFHFSPILILKAWAPALSEELIFRVFLPACLFAHFNLEDSFGNKVWVFFVVTIPFALLHCANLIIARDLYHVIIRCCNDIFHSLFCVFLIRRYGFFYGAYAHALMDFLAMSCL